MSDFPRELSSQELEVVVPRIPPITESGDPRAWAKIGQPRGVKALEMGIAVRAKGYNLFVAGEPGTGRYTAVRDIADKNSHLAGELRDIAYVHNFEDPDKPRALAFPKGKARKFQKELKNLLESLKNHIAQALDSKTYKNLRDKQITKTEKQENKLLTDFESRLAEAGFRTVQTSDDSEEQATDIVPLIEGEPVPFEDLQDMISTGAIPESFWNETRERYFVFMDDMQGIYRDLRKAREKLDRQIEELKIAAIRKGVEEETAGMKSRWDIPAVLEYLNHLQEDVLEHPDWFTGEENEEEEIPDLSLRFGVNILVDRHGTQGIPIVQEANPTLPNLFGTIEAHNDIRGDLKTSLMMIRAGSLLQADGGLLILHAQDIFAKEGLWSDLKRVLKTSRVEPEVQSTSLGPLPILMKPEPFSIDVKVILIGPPQLYENLCSQDEEFQDLFKIVAEFSPFMPRSPQTEREYASFIHSFAASEKLRPVTPEGIQEITAYGIRLSEHRDRLSTRFRLIGDLLREANYHAGQGGKEEITPSSVKEALETRIYLGNLPEKIQNEQIREGTLLIDVQKKAVGTVNGLAVLERGFYTFGSPLRITAAVSPGKEGIINIEREAGLSGELHNKGVLILEGCLRALYSRNEPLSLTASLAVEQSYYEIEGDSAAAAELAALLSAIGKIPLRQDLAVTGAVDQRGVLLPVGGIPEKVEGFFNACQTAGFTGTQGVIVPWRNHQSILLSEKVMTALKEKRFHLWAADTMDDILSLLSGMPPGEPRRKGHFPKKSVNEKIIKGLRELG